MSQIAATRSRLSKVQNTRLNIATAQTRVGLNSMCGGSFSVAPAVIHVFLYLRF